MPASVIKIKGRVETLPFCDPTKQSHEIKTNYRKGIFMAYLL